jgi:hypothetical protein
MNCRCRKTESAHARFPCLSSPAGTTAATVGAWPSRLKILRSATLWSRSRGGFARSRCIFAKASARSSAFYLASALRHDGRQDLASNFCNARELRRAILVESPSPWDAFIYYWFVVDRVSGKHEPLPGKMSRAEAIKQHPNARPDLRTCEVRRDPETPDVETLGVA